jgi:hypothetical protein
MDEEEFRRSERCDLPDAEMILPHNAPEATRIAKEGTWRRLGVKGNLSPINSPTANVVRVFAVIDDWNGRNRDLRIPSKLRFATWLKTAGGVNVRNPASTPMAADNARVFRGFMNSSFYEFSLFVIKLK